MRFSVRSAASRLDRAQVALLSVLLMLAVVAWLVTHGRMAAMESMPAMDLGDLSFYLTIWVVMMAAMMFPSVAPTVLMYDRLREGHRARGKGAAPDATALFVAGYLLVWTAAGLKVYEMCDHPAARALSGYLLVRGGVHQVAYAARSSC